MRLIKLPVYRGRIGVCRCGLCGIDIPQPVPRHRCRRCEYHVCYDCGLRFAVPGGSSSDSSTWSSDRELLMESAASTVTLRDKFWAKVERRVRHRTVHVAISKFYETVAPVQGLMRTRGHCRRRDAVAEDCHFPTYSDANLRLVPPPTVTTAAAKGGSGARIVPVKAEGCSKSVHVLANAVLARVIALTNIVAAEGLAGQDCLDSEWEPDLVRQEPDAPEGQKKTDTLTWLLGGSDIMERLLELCSAAEEIMRQQPILSEVSVPVKVYGDVHGQLRDMLLLFHYYGWPGPSPGSDRVGGERMSYVFNGDWVDRGRHQLEVVVILLALKIMYPERIWFNRGNHEDLGQNLKTTREGSVGFDKACEDALGQENGARVFQAFHSLFGWLPLAARIEGRILVLHGGLGNGDWTLEDLKSVQRPLASAQLLTALDGAVYNMLWSDPLLADRASPVETFGVHRSHRSKHNHVMQTFGRDITERFCARERLSLVVRSHQFRKSGKGYELMHDGWLMRVFSARNYTGRHTNDGGLLLVGNANGTRGTLLIRPQVIERMVVPQEVTPAVSVSEPYCPRAHLMHLARPRENTSSCMVFSWQVRQESLTCAECGLQRLEEGLHYSCRGCLRYSLCVGCAGGRRVETPQAETVPSSDTEFSSIEADSEVSSEVDHREEIPPNEAPPPLVRAARVGNLPTLLTSGRLRGGQKPCFLPIEKMSM